MTPILQKADIGENLDNSCMTCRAPLTKVQITFRSAHPVIGGTERSPPIVAILAVGCVAVFKIMIFLLHFRFFGNFICLCNLSDPYDLHDRKILKRSSAAYSSGDFAPYLVIVTGEAEEEVTHNATFFGANF